MNTRVKIVAVVEYPGRPCWPCVGFDFDSEIERIMKPIYSLNPSTDFDVVKYHNNENARAEAEYESDRTKYDGVVVIGLTCGSTLHLLYARKAKEGGIPTVIADIPFCGTGSIIKAGAIIKAEHLPTPLVMSSDYADIAKNIRLFDVIRRMKQAKILVVAERGTYREEAEKAATALWGCSFVYRSAEELNDYFDAVPRDEAAKIAEKWKKEAKATVEPTDADIDESARLYLAIKRMKEEENADAVTVDCLGLSYRGDYRDGAHMYPCLSHFEMNRHGEVAVCEADINATVASLVALYLTGRPGYVSDPVLDTSTGTITYSHCVACTKVFGKNDSCTCDYVIRSHAEDKKGASVQVLFPEGEPLTTVMFDLPKRDASIHSSVSCGNRGGDEGCRSKLVAKANAAALRDNWMGGFWHRVTVFGEYRELFMNLLRMKDINVIEEDKA